MSFYQKLANKQHVVVGDVKSTHVGRGAYLDANYCRNDTSCIERLMATPLSLSRAAKTLHFARKINVVYTMHIVLFYNGKYVFFLARGIKTRGHELLVNCCCCQCSAKRMLGNRIKRNGYLAREEKGGSERGGGEEEIVR